MGLFITVILDHRIPNNFALVNYMAIKTNNGIINTTIVSKRNQRNMTSVNYEKSKAIDGFTMMLVVYRSSSILIIQLILMNIHPLCNYCIYQLIVGSLYDLRPIFLIWFHECSCHYQDSNLFSYVEKRNLIEIKKLGTTKLHYVFNYDITIESNFVRALQQLHNTLLIKGALTEMSQTYSLFFIVTYSSGFSSFKNYY